MANRYFKLAAGNNNWGDTSTWCTLADGSDPGASVPTSADNVYPSSSIAAGATLTVNVTANCLDMDWTGATNTPTLAGSSAVNIYGSLTLISAMNKTYLGGMTFKSTATGKTVTAGGTLVCPITFDGVGGGWTLQDTLNNTLAAFALNNGALNTGGQTVTVGTFTCTSGSVRSLTIDNSTISCTGWNLAAANLTWSYTNSIINQASANGFLGAGLTYATVNIVNTTYGDTLIKQANTFATLTVTGKATTTDTFTLWANQTVTGTFTIVGNSPSNRLIAKSDTFNTPRTINCTGATTNFTDCDFQDIVISGSPTVGTNVRVGDCGGNTGQTFTAAAPKYWQPGATGGTGSWSDATNHWALSDGGATGANNYPLPQDTALFVASSVTAGGKTITMDEPRYSGIDFSSVANTPTISLSVAPQHFGSLDLTGIGAYTHNGNYDYFYNRAAATLKTATFALGGLRIYAVGSSVTLSDALTCTNSAVLVAAGTFSFGNQNATIYALQDSGSITKAVTLGSGTITCGNTSVAILWSLASATIDSSGNGTIVLTEPGVVAHTFSGGSKTYANLTIQGAGAFAATISGSNTFATLTVDRSAAAKTLKITNNTTQTVSNFVCATSGTTVLTITNTSGTTAGILTKSGGGNIQCDYLDLSYNTGSPANSWYYGASSTIGAGVTGWAATPPTPVSLSGSLTPTGAVTGIYRQLKSLAGTLITSSILGRNIFKQLSGSLTPSGAVSKLTKRLVSGSATFVGVVNRKIYETFTGSITPTGVVTRLLTKFKTLTGALTPSGTLGRNIFKSLTGSLTPTGVVTRIKIQFKSLSGSLSFTSTLGRSIIKSLSGVLTMSGVVSRVAAAFKSLSGMLTPSGTLSRTIKLSLAGVLTMSGALAKLIKKLLAGSLTMSGNLVKLAMKNLSGAVTFTGALSRKILKSLVGTLTPTGSLTKIIVKTLTGLLSTSGSLGKKILLSLSGVLSSSGSLAYLKTAFKVLAGVLSTSGTLGRNIYKSLTGTVAISGILSNINTFFKVLAGYLTPGGVLGRSISKSLTGILTSSGSLTNIKTLFKSLSGVITMTGSLGRSIYKTLTGELTSSGVVSGIKSFFKTLLGSLTPSGTLGRNISKSLAGVLTFSGSVGKLIKRALTGALTFIGTLLHQHWYPGDRLQLRIYTESYHQIDITVVPYHDIKIYTED